MRVKLTILFALILMLISLACASGHVEPFPQNQPLIREIAMLEDRITNAVSTTGKLSHQIIGETAYHEKLFPLWIVSFDAGSTESDFNVLICGGIHGNEPAGVEVIIQFIETLAEKPEMYQHIDFDIIPVVNTWAWSHDLRFNREGIDVNRDFASFVSQEAQIIRDFINGKSYDLIIDCHEDPDAKGFYLYQYANPSTELSRDIIGAIRDLGYPIEQDVNMIVLKTEDGLIDAPLWGLWYMKLTGQLSMANYFRLNNSKQVYTLETPTILSWDERVEMQEKAINMLLNSLTP